MLLLGLDLFGLCRVGGVVGLDTVGGLGALEMFFFSQNDDENSAILKNTQS